MQKRLMMALTAGLLSASMFTPTNATEKPIIVTTLPPIQSLTEALVGDLAKVQPLSNAGATPHGRSLKPSDLRKLGDADLVIQVGPVLESSIQKVLNSNVEADHILTLEDIAGLHLLPARKGGVWGNGHDHDDHKDEAHESHAHEEHEGHNHDDHADEKHEEHGDHDDHATSDDHVYDAHIWLSVDNAKVMVDAIEASVVAEAPELADDLARRKVALLEKLDQLKQNLTVELAGLGDVSYLVFHDAYQYFEDSYGLNPAGAVLLDPERKPGARRLSELRDFVEENNVKCVFTEPQFEPKLVKILQEDTNLKVGELDPIGFGIDINENQYFVLLQNLATSLKTCLVG